LTDRSELAAEDGMTKRPLQHKQEKKDRIILAAARAFAQNGFSGTTMAAIAKQADIGKGTIYEYFETKEDLFFAVFTWYSRRMSEAATVAVSELGGSAAQRIRAVSRSLLNVTEEIKDLFALTMEFWAAANTSPLRSRFADDFRQLYSDFRNILAGLIREGVQRGEFRPDVDPEAVAAVMVGSWDGLILQAWFEGTFDPHRAAKKFLDTLFGGLARQTTPNPGSNL
jgi:AcrR family transcriptional regulator